LGLTSLGLSLLAGASARLLVGPIETGTPGHRAWLSSLALVLLALLAVVPQFVLLYPTRRNHTIANPTIRDVMQYESTEGALGTTGGEYLPIGVDYLPEPSPMLPAYEGKVPMERLNRPSLPAGVQADLLRRSGSSEAYRFKADSPTTILMNVLYFPSWQAYVDGQRVDVSAFKPYGLVTFTVPAGERLVELRRELTPLALVATWISYISLSGLLLVVLSVFVPRRRRLSMPATSTTSPAAVPTYALTLGVAILSLSMLKLGFIDGQTSWFRTTTAAGTAAGRQNPLSVDFGGQISCLGYDLDARQVKPGGTVRLRLYWETDKQLATDYSVFVHLVSRPGQPPVAQKDSLHPANLPTSRWVPGKYVPDMHEISISATLQPGEYELIIGLYDPSPGGKRLSVGGREGDNAYYSLGMLVVQP
jgi:hypothetical protein